MAPIAAGRFKAKHVRGGCSWIAEPLPRVYYTRGYFHRVLRMTQGGSSISSDAAAADDAGLDFRELTEPQMAQLEYADTLVSDQICQQISDRQEDGLPLHGQQARLQHLVP
jgi:hypothetical protein